MKREKYKAGDIIGGHWKLLRLLGAGGNAEVWKAKEISQETHSNDVLFAIKILRSIKKEEPLSRFKSEVSLLNKYASFNGIMPLLDSSIPSKPTKFDPPWYSMPIAIPCRQVLKKADLTEVVQAIASIARTLAIIHEKGDAHRDIKPENLFKLDDDWIIGDFGLAINEFKSRDILEESFLGPQHYIAPEMVYAPKEYPGYSADVYGLAKTLWVIACRHKYPPPGEHRVDQPVATISRYVKHPHAHSLDRILEASTNYFSEMRLTMEELAQELDLWLQIPGGNLPNIHKDNSGEISKDLVEALQYRDSAVEIDQRQQELKNQRLSIEQEYRGRLRSNTIDYNYTMIRLRLFERLASVCSLTLVRSHNKSVDAMDTPDLKSVVFNLGAIPDTSVYNNKFDSRLFTFFGSKSTFDNSHILGLERMNLNFGMGIGLKEETLDVVLCVFVDRIWKSESKIETIIVDNQTVKLGSVQQEITIIEIENRLLEVAQKSYNDWLKLID
ncbi:protein kinase [Candidatus Acetothermia bacterium]|nr:protein kinase [Candidatus Acetothermia bacterium]MBI3642713.1 protein kinase [Candidatus Acetothermia bacterium]